MINTFHKYSSTIFYALFCSFIMIILPSSCRQNIPSVESNIKEKSFEGMISYGITITYKDEIFENNYKKHIDQMYGDIAHVYINLNGDIYREFPNSGSSGYIFNLYKKDVNQTYVMWKSFDTLYVYNNIENSLVSEEFIERENKTILNRLCKSFECRAYEKNTGNLIVQTYYYDQSLYFDSRLIADYQDFFTNKIYDKMKSVYLSLEIDFGSYMVTYTAKNILEKALGDDLFNVPFGYPKKTK